MIKKLIALLRTKYCYYMDQDFALMNCDQSRVIYLNPNILDLKFKIKIKELSKIYRNYFGQTILR